MKQKDRCIDFLDWAAERYEPQGMGEWKLIEADELYSTEELYNKYILTWKEC